MYAGLVFNGSLVGWLGLLIIGWLVGLVIGWLVGLVIGWLVGLVYLVEDTDILL